MKELMNITKNDLRNALDKIGNQNRFFKPGRYLLCREVYKGIGEGVTYDCFTYQDEGIDELFRELNRK